ncbi:RHS repeat-associated core domain-containing protein, partial [bacterium]
TVLAYQYDADGTRMQKTINGQIINFLVDKNCEFSQVIEERDGSDNLIVQYIHGLDLIAQNRSNVLSYFLYDGQHSTRQLSDGLAAVTDKYTYDAFGLLLQRTGSTQNDYMYTGEQYDPNVGFYYLRARYYNPKVGRFTTVDLWKGSIYDPVSLHKYIYCNNDPVDFVDWSGEYTKVEFITTVVMIGIFSAILAIQISYLLNSSVSDNSLIAGLISGIISMGVAVAPWVVGFGLAAIMPTLLPGLGLLVILFVIIGIACLYKAMTMIEEQEPLVIPAPSWAY